MGKMKFSNETVSLVCNPVTICAASGKKVTGESVRAIKSNANFIQIITAENIREMDTSNSLLIRPVSCKR